MQDTINVIYCNTCNILQYIVIHITHDKRCNTFMIFLPFPLVWSLLGPVPTDGDVLLVSDQSKLSLSLGC